MKKIIPLTLCLSALLFAQTSKGDLNSRKDSLCQQRAFIDSIRTLESDKRASSRGDNIQKRKKRECQVNSMIEQRELLSK